MAYGIGIFVCPSSIKISHARPIGSSAVKPSRHKSTRYARYKELVQGLEIRSITSPPDHHTSIFIAYATMTTRQCFLLFVLLSLVCRAISFSASPPPPPPSSGSSGPGNEGTKRLKAPPKPIVMPFMGQIKRARSARDAIGVIARIERQGYHPDMYHYSAIISKCAKQKLVDKALGLLKRMINQGVTPDVVVFGAVIDACANAGQYKSAISLLNDMEDKHGVQPNVKCFSSAISGCEKAAQGEEAVKLLRKMREKGVEPDVIAYSSVISACEKGGGKYTETALSLLNEAKSAGIKLDVKIYNSAISACEKGGGKYTETALSLLQEMKKEGIRPDDYSYNSAISACGKGGAKYTDTALSLFHEMKKAGVNPDGVTCTAITKASFDSKRYSEALQLARDAMDRGILRIKTPTENGLPKWDLNRLSEATACMLLTDALLSLVESNKGREPPCYQDIIVITGKGVSAGKRNFAGSALKVKVPPFLNDVAGLETTAIEGNEGEFLITAASLEEWVASGAYEKLKGLLE